MKITDIRTDLFTQCTITDFGVRLVYFDEEKWKESNTPPIYKQTFAITVSIHNDGSIRMVYMNTNRLTAEQLDEIQRISKLLRMEK